MPEKQSEHTESAQADDSNLCSRCDKSPCPLHLGYKGKQWWFCSLVCLGRFIDGAIGIRGVAPEVLEELV